MVLEVFNVVGEKISVTDLGKGNAMQYDYNTTTLDNGVYFFRISAGNSVVTKGVTVSH